MKYIRRKVLSILKVLKRCLLSLFEFSQKQWEAFWERNSMNSFYFSGQEKWKIRIFSNSKHSKHFPTWVSGAQYRTNDSVQRRIVGILQRNIKLNLNRGNNSPPDLKSTNSKARQVANDKNGNNSAADLCQVEVSCSPRGKIAFYYFF